MPSSTINLLESRVAGKWNPEWRLLAPKRTRPDIKLMSTLRVISTGRRNTLS
jgi:hypothetical protein